MSPIHTLQRRLRELGRIRMGRKGDRGQPQKLATWRLTSASKSLIDNAAELHGGSVQEWQGAPTEGKQWEVILASDILDVVVPPGNTLSQWYELWSGGGAQKRCDGQRQVLRDVPCSCPSNEEERSEFAKKGKACKPTTRLNVMIPNLPDLGVWRLESHGYHAAAELAGMAELCERASAQGIHIPARLRLDQRTQKRDGQTRHFAVPVLEVPEKLGDILEAVGALGAGGRLNLQAPVERKALPGKAADPEAHSFGIEQAHSIESASMPDDRPALPDDTAARGVPEWLQPALDEGATRERIVLVARHLIDERGGNPNLVSKLEDLASAPPDLQGHLLLALRRGSEVTGSATAPAEPTAEGPTAHVSAASSAAPSYPCPQCGDECHRHKSSKSNKQWWDCENGSCDWQSWHSDPWKPGGQIETEFAKDTAKGVGEQAVSGSAVSGVSYGEPEHPLQELSGDELASAKDQALDLIERALDRELIRFADVSRAAAFVLSKLDGEQYVPTRRTNIKNASTELLSGIAYRLELADKLEPTLLDGAS